MFFSVFNITDIENEVSVKYKTKNINTDCKEVFLATKNQRRANTISSRNFKPIDTRLYKVWLSGSLICPLKKTIKVINEINEKAKDKITTSLKEKFTLTKTKNRYAAINSNTFKNARNKRYLGIGFSKSDHLIKSLMATYIAAKTPRRESTMVKTGVCQPVSLSSFTPPQTVTRIIPIIWKAIPEYRPKSWSPLF